MKKQYRCKRVKFLDTLRQTKSLMETISAHNITYEIFLEWLSKYDWFREEIKAVDKMNLLWIQNKLVELIDGGNVQAIQTYLRNINALSIVETEQSLKYDNDNGFKFVFTISDKDKYIDDINID